MIKKIFLALVIGFGVLVAIGLMLPAAPPANTAQDAALVCRQFVRPRLKAPSTATFPNVYNDDPGVTYGRLGAAHVVHAWVDSQNGFGAMIRTRFTCTTTFVGPNWRLDTLTIGE